MDLNSKIKVDLPDEGVIVRRSGAYPTVYKVIRSYRNAKGQPTNERVTIGKLDPSSGRLIPNEAYYLHYPRKESAAEPDLAPEPDLTPSRSAGAAFLVHSLASRLGLIETLALALGEARAKSLLTAAQYMLARGNIFEDVLDYCQEFSLAEPPLTTEAAAELFSSITDGEREAFFKSWLAKQPAGPYILYEATSFSDYAEGKVDAKFSYDQGDEKLSQISVACYFSQISRLPVFYLTNQDQEGEKSRLLISLFNNDLKARSILFVLSPCFCSEKNLKGMSKSRVDFVVAPEAGHKEAQDAIERERSEIARVKKDPCHDVGAISKPGLYYGVEAVMHVYYDVDLARRQRADFEREIASKSELLRKTKRLKKDEARNVSQWFKNIEAPFGMMKFKLDQFKISKAVGNFGFFCLLSSPGIDSSKALEIYLRQAAIEKNLDNLKNHADMPGLPGETSLAATSGKLFCSFIALILSFEIKARLGESMIKNSWTQKKVIARLERIRARRMRSDGRYHLESPLAEPQREILERLGLSESDLVAFIEERRAERGFRQG
jgi:hypothetical protein